MISDLVPLNPGNVAALVTQYSDGWPIWAGCLFWLAVVGFAWKVFR